MGKTRQWIISIVVFLLIGIILFLNISDILRKKSGGESDMIHSFYQIEKDTLDVLCLGSSHGYSAIQPNTLWKEFGLASYVMCSQKQSIGSSYYLLKEALNYQKPKIVLLESYYFYFGRKYTEEGSLRMGFDGMRMGRVKWEMVQDFLGELSVKDKLSYYLPFLEYHSRWDSLEDLDFHPKNYLKGSILDFTVYPMEEPALPDEGRKIPDISYEYFEKIIALCREHDIQLILYAAPYGYENEAGYEKYMKRQKINITLESYLEKKNIPFIYYQKNNVADLDYQADFRDFTHLNINGSIKLTRNLGDYMKKNYTLPDHRQEDQYRSWWADYDRFEKDMAEARKNIQEE